jgi:tRNA (guanosine-2'-O-)-methyltransferase
MENSVVRKQLLEFLMGFVSENKKLKFDEIIHNRTRYLTVVLEDVFQSHNASAVLRTCECLGIQDVHIIENNYQYQVNTKIALGASKYLTINTYNQEGDNTGRCLGQLRQKGYRIIATTPRKEATLLEDIDIGKGPVALFFGTEIAGLTDIAFRKADELVRIPMYGLTESYNISVSAALILYNLTEKLKRSGISWRLRPDEETDVRIQWAKSIIRKPDDLERTFYKQLKVGDH